MNLPRRQMSSLSIESIFEKALSYQASDIHIKPYSPPRIRIDGELTNLSQDIIPPDEIQNLLDSIMTDKIKSTFEKELEVDFAVEVKNLGRLRVNAYQSRGFPSIAARIILSEPRTLQELGIPAIAEEIALLPDGLCIIAGATGSGKSTTLAAMIHHINVSKNSHVVTIEDPIEFIHQDQKALISQREVSFDTKDFSTALKSVLRQDPDVIMVGEMRDTETARTALNAAETGHLVLSTLHTTTASDTISRIVDLFPDKEQEQIRISLSTSLRAIFCQKLLPTIDNKRYPATEILLNRGRIPEAIADLKKTSSIVSIIENNNNYGMQSMEEALMGLVLNNIISPKVAAAASRNAHDFGLELRKHGLEKK